MRRYLNSKCQDTVLFFFFLILIAKRKTVLLLKGLDSLKSTYIGDRFGEQKFLTLRKKCGDRVWRQSPYRINLSLEHVSPMNIEKEPQEAHIESTFPRKHSYLFTLWLIHGPMLVQYVHCCSPLLFQPGKVKFTHTRNLLFICQRLLSQLYLILNICQQEVLQMKMALSRSCLF